MAIFYEKGRYRCRVTGQGFSKASTGTPQLFIKFVPLALIHGPGDEESVQGYERTFWRALTDNTIDYTLEDLQNLDVNVESLMHLDPAHPSHVSIVGEEKCFWVQPDSQKPDREKWGVAKSASASDWAPKPVDQGGLKKLDAMFGAARKKAGLSSKPVSAARAPQPVAAAAMEPDSALISDDDLPW